MNILSEASNFIKNVEMNEHFTKAESLRWIRQYLAELQE